jgi:very-short-patch-repair endonuclease
VNSLKFRRQHPTGPYSLDFYCGDARLAIEVDGEAHRRGDRPAPDQARDNWLARAAIETMRIPANEILHDLDAVLRGIRGNRPPAPPPACGRSPSPSKLGEE